MSENLKVRINIGLPASGKSSESKEFVRKNDKWIRVCRDDFRLMLKTQQVCENKIESLITELCDDLIVKSLSKRLNIIVDNTHLKVKYINHVIDLVSTMADVDYRLFDVPMATCIQRDKERELKVGEDVIRRMNKDFLILKDSFHFQPVKKKHRIHIEPPYDKNLKDIIIVDLDGTLFHMNGKRGPYDWMKVDRDEIDKVVAEQVRLYKKNGYTVFLVSGRDEVCRELTELSLEINEIEYDRLIMRKKDDYRKDSIIKKEIYDNEIKDKYNVRFLLDDRDQVVNMYRSLGLKVFQVNPGSF